MTGTPFKKMAGTHRELENSDEIHNSPTVTDYYS
jgi:hypothetical protein